jgi:hypothetical protein
MQTSLSLVSILSPLVLLGACTAGGDDDPVGTEIAGLAQYRDSATDHDGTARQPATPPPQQATAVVVVEGTGTFPQLDPACALDPAGAFTATFLGELTLSADGAYLAVLGAGSGTITTPSGCTLADLELGLVTDVRVRAELAATTENCSTYCEASARADAEAACGASAEAASCRTTAEAEARAACTTTCTRERTAIVAETSLRASVLAGLDAEMLRAAALGELQVHLVFDRAE